MTDPETGGDEIQVDSQDFKSRGTQIGISQLLAITACVSVVCAVLASVLRRLPKEQQTKGAIFIFSIIFICLVTLAIFYFLRWRAEKLAGPSHFITKAPLSSWFHFFGILSCALTLGIMVIGLWSIVSLEDTSTIWSFASSALLLGAFTGNYLMNALLWKTNPASLDVRQNGIIFGTFKFVPWSRFHGFRWNQYTHKVTLLMDGRFGEWNVPANQRSQLEAELGEFIPKKAGFS